MEVRVNDQCEQQREMFRGSCSRLYPHSLYTYPEVPSKDIHRRQQHKQRLGLIVRPCLEGSKRFEATVPLTSIDVLRR